MSLFIADPLHRQIVGVIASVERAIADAEERGNVFFSNILEKQHQRLKSIFDRHVVSIRHIFYSFC